MRLSPKSVLFCVVGMFLGVLMNDDKLEARWDRTGHFVPIQLERRVCIWVAVCLFNSSRSLSLPACSRMSCLCSRRPVRGRLVLSAFGFGHFLCYCLERHQSERVRVGEHA